MEGVRVPRAQEGGTSWKASGFPGLKSEGKCSSNARMISGQTEFTKKSYPGTALPFSLRDKSKIAVREPVAPLSPPAKTPQPPEIKSTPPLQRFY